MNDKSKILKIFNFVKTKLVLTSLIIATFVFMFIFNIIFLNFKDNGRGLASNTPPSVQTSFIKRLSKLPPSEMTQFSEQPSKIDKLRFELLKGRYDVFKVQNRVQRLRLNTGEEGVALESPKAFLTEYKELLINNGAHFKRLENRTFKRDISSSMKIESYEIIEDNQLKGRLDFEYGVDGSLTEVQMHWL